MPVMKCRKDGQDGYKWGENGVCFIGEGAEEKAAAVGRAVHARQNAVLFELSEKNADGPNVQVSKVGKFNHPIYGRFAITSEDHKQMKRNLEENSRGQLVDGKPVIPIDYYHEDKKVGGGWIRKLEIKDDHNGVEGLFAEVDWTPASRKKIKDKELLFTSPDFVHNYSDKETGEKFGTVLRAVALTNKPFLRGMESIPYYTLSEDSDLSGDTDFNLNLGENMPELIDEFKSMSPEDQEKFLAECGLMPKDKKLSEELEQVKGDLEEKEKALRLAESERDELKKQADSGDKSEALKLAEGKIGDLEKEVLKLTQEREADKKEAEFNVMLSEGKVCPAQKDAFLKGDMAEFAKNAQPIKLDGTGRNAKDDDEKDAASKVMKLAEEKTKAEEGLSLSDAIAEVLYENPALNRQYEQEA